MSDWNQSRLEALISDRIEEGSRMEYKSAAALGGQESLKIEITKDVSAFANAAGGILIYGIAEFDDKDKRHLPEKLDPIDRTRFSRERLDQVIGNIQPRIEGLSIVPVEIDGDVNLVAYVVIIPQGSTAHQATDKRYHRRYNFQVVAMDDYEIRDVMGRQKHPQIGVEFTLEGFQDGEEVKWTMVTEVSNGGAVYAHYLSILLFIPEELAAAVDRSSSVRLNDGRYARYVFDNTAPLSFEVPVFVPLLPGRSIRCFTRLADNLDIVKFQDRSVRLSISADNAPPQEKAVLIGDLLQGRNRV